MEKYTSIEAVLERAIEIEEESVQLYATLASAAKNAPVRTQLEELAEMERGHKAKLEQIRAGNIQWTVRRSQAEPVSDLRLTDHLEARPIDPNADYQTVLLAAAKREKMTHDFYTAMGEQVDDAPLKSLFEMLAMEELRHKYLLEKIYEDVVYQAF
jgi:rubrerythrin